MASARALCPHCRTALKASKDNILGKEVRCPSCHATFTITRENLRPPTQTTEVLQAIPHTPPPPGNYTKQAPPESPAPTPTVEKDPLSPVKVCCYGGLILVVLGSLLALPFLLSDGPATELRVAAKPHPPTTPPTTKPEPKTRQKQKAPPEPPLLTLPEAEQQQVNRAIAKGVAFLQQHPPNGRFPQYGAHRAGVESLWGLTLLECGVPASAAQIQKIASSVRKAVPRLDKTYDLGLTILFLDRLGEDQDHRRIQTLALRLIAGQLSSGGWNYDCPILSTPDEEQFYLRLEQSLPENPIPEMELERSEERRLTKLARERALTEVKLVPEQSLGDLPKTLIPLHQQNLRPQRKKKLSPNLQNHHALKPIPKQSRLSLTGRTDNSNTQFAILGLWTARRSQVPMDQSLILMVKRFRKSQRNDGAWTYRTNGGFGASSEQAMTCTGLLGLAVGRGLIAEMLDPSGKTNVALKDPTLKKGMKALAGMLDDNSARSWRKQPMNLYALWSLERVGVLYQRRHFGKTDWYQEVAMRLVKEQRPKGNWAPQGRSYPGAHEYLDTCFALLILKRSNLTPGLSERLIFVDPK